ncbi:hypothetical protein JX266_002266 [Neoarthrinium moseri]|nr:hypothetical protein JX266_002266 [Neoarthrinium moseri]
MDGLICPWLGAGWPLVALESHQNGGYLPASSHISVTAAQAVTRETCSDAHCDLRKVRFAKAKYGDLSGEAPVGWALTGFWHTFKAPTRDQKQSVARMDMSSHSMSNSSDCQVSMLWNWYTIDACFLSESWHITNNGMFAATCIGVILLGVILEFLRRVGKEYDALILRQFQRHVSAQAALSKASKSAGASCCAPAEVGSTGPRIVTFRATPLQQLVRSVIHAITFGLAYIIMLLAMYFNGYIIICIIIGAGIGKFVCDWMVHKVVIDDEDSQEAPKGVEEPTVCCG